MSHKTSDLTELITEGYMTLQDVHASIRQMQNWLDNFDFSKCYGKPEEQDAAMEYLKKENVPWMRDC
ncbi:hypothetical protein Ddc_08427 [Ditylenchus destructor]|nr:hypothetical protein Ddc_08427 [Ditylenchus destructor]